jgi:hypothetical protein
MQGTCSMLRGYPEPSSGLTRVYGFCLTLARTSTPDLKLSQLCCEDYLSYRSAFTSSRSWESERRGSGRTDVVSLYPNYKKNIREDSYRRRLIKYAESNSSTSLILSQSLGCHEFCLFDVDTYRLDLEPFPPCWAILD